MKAYDKVRSRFVPGAFYCIEEEGRLIVKIHYAYDDELELSIGNSRDTFKVQKDTAQVLSDFFADVANSLNEFKRKV